MIRHSSTADCASEPAIHLIGAPVEQGAARPGCRLAPAALRAAGLAEALRAAGRIVLDEGDIAPRPATGLALDGHAKNADAVAGWIGPLAEKTFTVLESGGLPLTIGGDHSLSMGSVAGAARHAEALGRPLFLIWLDAHADFNTPLTSPTGNMHGMPVAFLTGEPGFDRLMGMSFTPLAGERVTLIGLRTVDAQERCALARTDITVHDMGAIASCGLKRLIADAIAAVEAAGGLLHVSFDLDVIDPAAAPAVGTPVAGGLTLHQAGEAMRLLAESRLVRSADLVELNPLLDRRAVSARRAVALVSDLFAGVGNAALRPVDPEWGIALRAQAAQ